MRDTASYQNGQKSLEIKILETCTSDDKEMPYSMHIWHTEPQSPRLENR